MPQVLRYDYFAASEAPRKDREAPMYRVGKSAFGSGMRARMYSRVRISRMHVHARARAMRPAISLTLAAALSIRGP